MEKDITQNPDTFVEILQNRAERSPDKIAFTFIEKGGKSEIPITYFELDRRAKKVASILLAKNLKGERALLLYPPGLDYIAGFFGCLYAGVIAVPVYPPDPTRLKRSLPRLQAIVKDSQACVALTTGTIHSMFKLLNMRERVSKVPVVGNMINKMTHNKVENISGNGLSKLSWIVTDKYDNQDNLDGRLHKLKREPIAYLQYTSGSTGTPRGVIVTHQNLIHNSKMIETGFGLNREFQGVIWLPIYHDMGLIGGILQPIYKGFHTYLMSPIDFLKRPLSWLNIISNIKDTPVATGGPNFAYDLCIRRTSEEKSANLDLSNWKVAFTGAEPIRPATLEKFCEAFKTSGFNKSAFYPCYGLAEGTLIVSGGLQIEEPKYLNIDKKKLEERIVEVSNNNQNVNLQFVGSGQQILDEEIIIVEPETKTICKSNEVGEIWSKSPSVANGYWKNEEATQYTFHAFTSDTNEGPFLRTGDLGFLHEHELYVTGRLKDLIIINGRNHYPQDIEFTVEQSNSIFRPGCVAVFSIDVDDEEKLVVVQEVRSKNRTDWDDIILDIRKAILDNHELQTFSVVLIEPRTIFKTSSGKIQRRATKAAYLDGTLSIVKEWKIGSKSEEIAAIRSEPETVLEEEANIKEVASKQLSEIEDWMIHRLSETLEIEKENIRIDEPFVNYGLDSAKAVGLVGDLEIWLGLTLSPTIVWDYPSIRKLSSFLINGNTVQEDSSLKEVVEKQKVVEEKDEATLSNIEKMSDEEAEKELLKKLNDIENWDKENSK